jgi:hypothetical protein
LTNTDLDCLAFNATSRKLYVFECKRGHGSFDGDKIKAIDQRLDSIGLAINAYVATKGWQTASSDILILSFYGAKWKSKYPIYDRHSVARLFEPCVGRFIATYIDHIESIVTGAYSAELRDAVSIDRSETIFDLVNPDREEPWPDILFNPFSPSRSLISLSSL